MHFTGADGHVRLLAKQLLLHVLLYLGKIPRDRTVLRMLSAVV